MMNSQIGQAELGERIWGLGGYIEKKRGESGDEGGVACRGGIKGTRTSLKRESFEAGRRSDLGGCEKKGKKGRRGWGNIRIEGVGGIDWVSEYRKKTKAEREKLGGGEWGDSFNVANFNLAKRLAKPKGNLKKGPPIEPSGGMSAPGGG